MNIRFESLSVTYSLSTIGSYIHLYGLHKRLDINKKWKLEKKLWFIIEKRTIYINIIIVHFWIYNTNNNMILIVRK